MSAVRLSVWLLPDPGAALPIQALLDELARRHAGPAFRAHVTAYAGCFEHVDPLAEALDALAAELAPIPLRFAGVDVGTTFTKCLFARFDAHAGLRAVTERARTLSMPPADYVLDPHLSLYYGDPRRAPRLRAEAAFPCERVRFDRLAVIRSSGPSTDARDVASWTQAHEVPLRGGAA